MSWYPMDMGWWSAAAMAFWVIVFAGLLVAGTVALITLTSGDRHNAAHIRPSEEAERVLAARFARGDIDESEYRNRLTTLREHSGR
jgi:putative membrane protein